LASNAVMVRTALFPEITDCQDASVPMPLGVTKPSPVTTMRSIEPYNPRAGTPRLAPKTNKASDDKATPTTEKPAAPEDAAKNPVSFELRVGGAPEEVGMRGRTTTQVLLCCSMYLTAS